MKCRGIKNHLKSQESKKRSLLNLAAMAVRVVASIAKVRTEFETTLKGFQRNERKERRKERERKEGRENNSRF